VPVFTPVTMPVEVPTVAMIGLLLLHVPPVVASVRAVELATHVVAVPAIAVGNGLTVTVFVTLQPAPGVYVITAVPVAIPVTIPVAGPTDAFVLPVLHVPPVTGSLSVVVAPIQTVAVPVIGEGNGFAVNTLVTAQPVPME